MAVKESNPPLRRFVDGPVCNGWLIGQAEYRSPALDSFFGVRTVAHRQVCDVVTAAGRTESVKANAFFGTNVIQKARWNNDNSCSGEIDGVYPHQIAGGNCNHRDFASNVAYCVKPWTGSPKYFEFFSKYLGCVSEVLPKDIGAAPRHLDR
ncbi:MAG TPA: hypothetical protein VFE51_21225 [Verrucomicrobiae bacterium]|nr:hypothetical protein [Verrucomicrobiae bacterium]